MEVEKPRSEHQSGRQVDGKQEAAEGDRSEPRSGVFEKIRDISKVLARMSKKGRWWSDSLQGEEQQLWFKI